jgi:hypothetical protein
MPITEACDDKTEAIVNPSRMSRRIQNCPKIAVGAFGEHYIALLRECYESELIDELGGTFIIPVYKINYKGRDIAAYCSSLGGSAAAGQLEDMIAKGCEKFI